MTADQVLLVQNTFAQVLAIKEQAGNLFYKRLFEIAPETRPLFKGNLEEQSRKLMDTLALTVGLLRDQAALTGSLQALGRRHATYGVAAEHYKPVGETLLWTLEQGLGTDFNDKAREAWAVLYNTASAVMLDAAKRESNGDDKR